MFKWIGIVRRREGVSHDEIVDAWQNVHVPHVKGFADLVHYRITFFDGDQPGVDYDGMAELTFRDQEHFDNTFGKHAPPERDADGFGQYIAPDGLTSLFVREYVNVDGETSRDDVKISFFAKRKANLALEEFQAHWMDVHLPNVRAAVERTPSALRYVVNLVQPGTEAPYDGMASIWFRDRNATLGDLVGLKDDGYIGLVGNSMMVRGHEIVAVP